MATAYIEAIRKWARNLFKTVKLNCYNWLCFWILVAAGGIIEGTTKPTARYLSPSDWDDVKYPTKSDTVPASWLFVIALAVPIVVFTVYHFSHGCEIREYHDLLFGIVMNVVLTGVATDALKMGLGRPRPDFYERCFGHVYNNVTDIPPPSIERPDCTNTNESTVEEGRKSFPSGEGFRHAAWCVMMRTHVNRTRLSDDVFHVLSDAVFRRKIACLRWEGSCMDVDSESATDLCCHRRRSHTNSRLPTFLHRRIGWMVPGHHDCHGTVSDILSLALCQDWDIDTPVQDIRARSESKSHSFGERNRKRLGK